MIAAVLLAAGESRRMGKPKMILPWPDGGTLVERVACTFLEAGASPVVVVTGAAQAAVEAALGRLLVRTVHNSDFARGEMISSLQVGLASLEPAVEAALVSPGDLPFLRPATVRQLIERWRWRPSDLLAPSYRQRRGHPMLLVRRVWPDVLAIPRGQNLRDFLKARAEDIEYLVVDDPGVVRDLDTASDYSAATEDVSGHL